MQLFKNKTIALCLSILFLSQQVAFANARPTKANLGAFVPSNQTTLQEIKSKNSENTLDHVQKLFHQPVQNQAEWESLITNLLIQEFSSFQMFQTDLGTTQKMIPTAHIIDYPQFLHVIDEINPELQVGDISSTRSKKRFVKPNYLRSIAATLVFLFVSLIAFGQNVPSLFKTVKDSTNIQAEIDSTQQEIIQIETDLIALQTSESYLRPIKPILNYFEIRYAPTFYHGNMLLTSPSTILSIPSTGLNKIHYAKAIKTFFMGPIGLMAIGEKLTQNNYQDYYRAGLEGQVSWKNERGTNYLLQGRGYFQTENGSDRSWLDRTSRLTEYSVVTGFNFEAQYSSGDYWKLKLMDSWMPQFHTPDRLTGINGEAHYFFGAFEGKKNWKNSSLRLELGTRGFYSGWDPYLHDDYEQRKSFSEEDFYELGGTQEILDHLVNISLIRPSDVNWGHYSFTWGNADFFFDLTNIWNDVDDFYIDPTEYSQLLAYISSLGVDDPESYFRSPGYSLSSTTFAYKSINEIGKVVISFDETDWVSVDLKQNYTIILNYMRNTHTPPMPANLSTLLRSIYDRATITNFDNFKEESDYESIAFKPFLNLDYQHQLPIRLGKSNSMLYLNGSFAFHDFNKRLRLGANWRIPISPWLQTELEANASDYMTNLGNNQIFGQTSHLFNLTARGSAIIDLSKNDEMPRNLRLFFGYNDIYGKFAGASTQYPIIPGISVFGQINYYPDGFNKTHWQVGARYNLSHIKSYAIEDHTSNTDAVISENIYPVGEDDFGVQGLGRNNANPSWSYSYRGVPLDPLRASELSKYNNDYQTFLSELASSVSKNGFRTAVYEMLYLVAMTRTTQDAKAPVDVFISGEADQISVFDLMKESLHSMGVPQNQMGIVNMQTSISERNLLWFVNPETGHVNFIDRYRSHYTTRIKYAGFGSVNLAIEQAFAPPIPPAYLRSELPPFINGQPTSYYRSMEELGNEGNRQFFGAEESERRSNKYDLETRLLQLRMKLRNLRSQLGNGSSTNLFAFSFLPFLGYLPTSMILAVVTVLMFFYLKNHLLNAFINSIDLFLSFKADIRNKTQLQFATSNNTPQNVDLLNFKSTFFDKISSLLDSGVITLGRNREAPTVSFDTWTGVEVSSQFDPLGLRSA